MTTPNVNGSLVRLTETSFARPLPEGLRAARRDVMAAIEDLGTIPDDRLAEPWAWIGGSEEELRYGFYRIGETFERAAIDATAKLGSSGATRGRAAELIAPSTAARWDLQGVLIRLPEARWDADSGNREWTIRQTMGHTIATQRAYGVGTAWWQAQGYRVDDPDRPVRTPESLLDELPGEDADASGTPAQIRARLDEVLDDATERLAGLPSERLELGAGWSGFSVDVGFRLGRWSSHLREHTIQVEKTLVMLGHRPAEADRLVRLVLAAWGRAEAAVYGATGADMAVMTLAAAAREARETAREIAGVGRD